MHKQTKRFLSII